MLIIVRRRCCDAIIVRMRPAEDFTKQNDEVISDLLQAKAQRSALWGVSRSLALLLISPKEIFTPDGRKDKKVSASQIRFTIDWARRRRLFGFYFIFGRHKGEQKTFVRESLERMRSQVVLRSTLTIFGMDRAERRVRWTQLGRKKVGTGRRSIGAGRIELVGIGRTEV